MPSAPKTLQNDQVSWAHSPHFPGGEDLARQGFFEGLHFHRVISDFMIQPLAMKGADEWMPSEI